MDDLNARTLTHVGVMLCGRGQSQILRAHQHGHGITLGRPFEQRHTLAEDHGLVAIGRSGQAVSQTNERGHILSGRALVEILRSGDLLDLALVHHADTISHSQRFLLIVGHEHGGGAGVELNAANLITQLHTNLGVEGGKWLVEQQHARLDCQCTSQGHTLLLAAGHLLCVLLLA